MAKHLPSVVWALRRYKDGQYPRVYVATAGREHICIDLYNGDPIGHAVTLKRQDARMLARRINECLDATR